MNDGTTALMLAAQDGHVEIVRLLLESGADKHLAMNDGRTALIVAPQRGHLEIVELLLES